jgi:RimJ/RimL family protein N-acetyltransferase
MNTDSPIIRTTHPGDFDEVAALIYRSHTISFAPFASEQWVESRSLDEYQSKWRSLLLEDSPDSMTLVAVLDDVIVGTTTVSRSDAPDFDAQLVGMHVEPNLTGHGIGGELMNAALDFIAERQFARVQLGVIASNTRTRHFYAKYGWVLDQEIPDGIEGVPIVTYLLVRAES